MIQCYILSQGGILIPMPKILMKHKDIFKDVFAGLGDRGPLNFRGAPCFLSQFWVPECFFRVYIRVYIFTFRVTL